MSAPPGPVLGPCSSWISGADVAACCNASTQDSTGIFDTVALEASMALFEISGRQFTGLCTRKVRPCKDTCRCFGMSPSLGLGSWYWAPAAFSGWFNDVGERVGCGYISKVRLAGYPVRDITQVKIDGAIVAPSEYRLDYYRDLIRLKDPGPPMKNRWWPVCQDLDLDDSQPGTFSITYRHGVDPPQLGKDAAAQLACQMFLACGGQDCQLPAGATRVTRQGVEIERGLLADWFDPKKPTGLVLLDTFLRAYWRTRSHRRPAVFSPDVQKFARREGT